MQEIRELAGSGMNIARINLSHGDHDSHAESIANIRKVNEELPYPIGILLDTRGAEIRTHDLKTPMEVTKGDTVTFLPYGTNADESKKELMVNYDTFADDVRETNCILLDNGELSFDIEEIKADGSVVATAKQNGTIGSRRHVNLPGAYVDLPSITDKDWEDIRFGIDQDIDYVALSFIREAEEVEAVRDLLDEKASQTRIITKIETQQAVDDVVRIIEASDGIMVARGDLGAEVPFDKLPAMQNEIVMRCKDAGKPVIVATHMLESMKEQPIPTRAEITDVAHAAVTSADATMLSGETASGKHPVVALEAMSRILASTEEYNKRFTPPYELPVHDSAEGEAEAAVTLADTSDADAIIVFTRTGKSARLVSKFRPSVPIITFASTESLQGKITLHYGVLPFFTEFKAPEETVQAALEQAKNLGLLSAGQTVVLLSDTQAKEGAITSVQVREVS